MLIPLLVLELLDVELDALADSQVPVVLHEFDDLTLQALVVVTLFERFHLLNYYQISMPLRILKTCIRIIYWWFGWSGISKVVIRNL